MYFPGSCHCGRWRYIVKFDNVPPELSTGSKATSLESAEALPFRAYKCNCTVCQKAGLLHLRPVTPRTDLVVLSPLTIDADEGGKDEDAVVGDYHIREPGIRFLFCRHCGVRCVLHSGRSGIRPPPDDFRRAMVDLGIPEADAVWMDDTPDGHDGGRGAYMSVNGLTLDAPETRGLDLARLHELGRVGYCDGLHDFKGQMRNGRPHPGGVY